MTGNKEKLEIEAQIDRYVNGELSQEEVDNLWTEIIQDEHYMDYLQTSADLKEIAKQKPSRTVETEHYWMYAAAAAIVLILAVIGVLRFGYLNNTATVKPIETIELDYYRSANAAADLSSRKQIIRKAIELFNKGQFQQAIKLLNRERDKASDLGWVSELDITLGTFYYNKNKFNDAAYYFKDVIKYKDRIKVLTLEKAYWYLGNSYFQMNMLDKAESAMQNAYNLNGAYRRVAKSYLDAMANVQANQPS